jgi:hypothetical protein
MSGIKRIDSTYRGKPTHNYKIDGRKADGVTTLIGDGLPKPALLPWGIKSVAEYAADHLERLVEMQPMGREAIVSALKQAPYTERDLAAKRGTEVHALAERLIHGDEVDVPEELIGHVDSCVRFLDSWRLRPVLVEATVASRRWNYAGTLDVVADLPDGRRSLLDYKTSRSGIFGETALQLAAYAHAEVYLDGDEEKPVADLGITCAHAVWLRADGFDVYEVDITEPVFRTFLHVAYVARQAKQLKTLIGEPCTTPAEAVA